MKIPKSNNPVDLVFENHKMKGIFDDGRELAIPLEWFPKLRDASEQELNNWRFIGDGERIH